MNVNKNSNKLNDRKCSLENKCNRSEENKNKLSQEKCETIKIFLRQILAASGPFFSTLSGGMTSGFSAVLLPQLMNNDSPVIITENQASWIASIAVLPMAVGCILSGLMMEKFGRCKSQKIGNILFIIGWTTIGFSKNYETICIGRILTGLCTGIFTPLCLVYLAEISNPKSRGVMLACVPLAISSGILISHILGTLFHWKIAALSCALFPLIAFITMIFALESPSWLILKGRAREGEDAFRKLRGFSAESSTELNSMLQKKNSYSEESNSNQLVMENFYSASFLKPLLIMMCFFFIQQFSGVNAVVFYSVSIFSRITRSVNEYLSTIIIDIVRVIMSFIACILLKKLKRRTLAIFSVLMTGLSLLGLTVSNKFLIEEYSWVSLPFLIAYICFISIGTVPIPWVLAGEIFPQEVRDIGSGFCTCFAFVIFFIVVKISPHLFSILGAANSFLIFATIALIGSVFLYLFLPETKNVALHNIEGTLLKKEIKSVFTNNKV